MASVTSMELAVLGAQGCPKVNINIVIRDQLGVLGGGVYAGIRHIPTSGVFDSVF